MNDTKTNRYAITLLSNQLSTTFIAIFIIFAGFTFYMNAHYLTFAFLFISFKD